MLLPYYCWPREAIGKKGEQLDKCCCANLVATYLDKQGHSPLHNRLQSFLVLQFPNQLIYFLRGRYFAFYHRLLRNKNTISRRIISLFRLYLFLNILCVLVPKPGYIDSGWQNNSLLKKSIDLESVPSINEGTEWHGIHSRKEADWLDEVGDSYITSYANRLVHHTNARKSSHSIVPDSPAQPFIISGIIKQNVLNSPIFGPSILGNFFTELTSFRGHSIPGCHWHPICLVQANESISDNETSGQIGCMETWSLLLSLIYFLILNLVLTHYQVC